MGKRSTYSQEGGGYWYKRIKSDAGWFVGASGKKVTSVPDSHVRKRENYACLKKISLRNSS